MPTHFLSDRDPGLENRLLQCRQAGAGKLALDCVSLVLGSFLGAMRVSVGSDQSIALRLQALRAGTSRKPSVIPWRVLVPASAEHQS